MLDLTPVGPGRTIDDVLSVSDLAEQCATYALAIMDQEKRLRDADAEIERLRARLAEAERLLRWSRRFVPEHDGYDHNPFIGERERCEVCVHRTAIDAAMAADSADLASDLAAKGFKPKPVGSR